MANVKINLLVGSISTKSSEIYSKACLFMLSVLEQLNCSWDLTIFNMGYSTL